MTEINFLLDFNSQSDKNKNSDLQKLKQILKCGGKVLEGKSGIHIKKSHEGRFTRYLQQHPGMTAEQAKHSKNPHVRQMATFAINARKWKHKDGGVIYQQRGIIMPNTPTYFKQYGISPTKFISMYQALRQRGIPEQAAFDTTWQSNKEQPRGNYAFGRPSSSIDQWANRSSYSLNKGIYKAARDSTNYNTFINPVLKAGYNKNKGYKTWLLNGRDPAKQFINQYNTLNHTGDKPITQIFNMNNNQV